MALTDTSILDQSLQRIMGAPGVSATTTSTPPGGTSVTTSPENPITPPTPPPGTNVDITPPVPVTPETPPPIYTPPAAPPVTTAAPPAIAPVVPPPKPPSFSEYMTGKFGPATPGVAATPAYKPMSYEEASKLYGGTTKYGASPVTHAEAMATGKVLTNARNQAASGGGGYYDWSAMAWQKQEEDNAKAMAAGAAAQAANPTGPPVFTNARGRAIPQAKIERIQGMIESGRPLRPRVAGNPIVQAYMRSVGLA